MNILAITFGPKLLIWRIRRLMNPYEAVTKLMWSAICEDFLAEASIG
jgi:hypothetical protein